MLALQNPNRESECIKYRNINTVWPKTRLHYAFSITILVYYVSLNVLKLNILGVLFYHDSLTEIS